jgi:hypothetical protein
LPLKVTESVSSGKCRKIISYGFEWAFRYQLFAADAPIELDKPHILALAAETGFLLFKEPVPLKFKKKYQRFNAKGRPFD